MTYLHVYSHISVIPYFCFTYMQITAAIRWYSVMEYFIHSCMYTYYTLKAMEIKLPICFAIINGMQIVQMAISYIVTYMAYNQRATYKLECYITYQNSVLGLSYYIISCYFYLKFSCESYTYEKEDDEDRKIDWKVYQSLFFFFCISNLFSTSASQKRAFRESISNVFQKSLSIQNDRNFVFVLIKWKW